MISQTKNQSIKFFLSFLLFLTFASNAVGQMPVGTTSFISSAESGIQANAVAVSTIPPNAAGASSFKISCSSGNFPSCALMGLTLAQMAASLFHAGASSRSADGFSNSSSAGSATGTAAAITPGLYGTSGSFGTGTTSAQDAAALTSVGLGSLVSDYKSIKDAVSQSGVTVSADGSTVKAPNGKTFPSSAFSSAQAMKDAGFSDSQISGAESALADATKKAEAAKSKVASLTNDQGGGGGGGLGSGGGAGGDGAGRDGDPFGGLGKRGGAGNGKDKGVAGMSKKLGSDSIGVSGDDIFEMVTRRYQARDKVNTFLKN